MNYQNFNIQSSQMMYDAHPTFSGFRIKCGMTIEVAFNTS